MHTCLLAQDAARGAVADFVHRRLLERSHPAAECSGGGGAAARIHGGMLLPCSDRGKALLIWVVARRS